MFLVLRANITEYSQSNSSHVRFPLKWDDRSILPPYLTECTFKLLMFASEYSRQQSGGHNRVLPELEGSFSRGAREKQLSGRQKQGQSHQLVTGELQRNLEKPRVRAFVSCSYFHLVMIKKSTGMGAQISLHRSRKWPSTRVCNVPCNIFMCVCVNCMCTTPPIAIQFQRLMLQCMRSFLFLFRRSDASCVSVN